VEWLVPILFVFVSLAQWWIKNRKAGTPQSPNSDGEPSKDPLDEFGDLLEALGRRRHESPPPPPLPQKAPAPRILPPLEVPAMNFDLPSLPTIPISPQPRERGPYSKKMETRFITRRSFISPSTRWSEAIVLSEILAPPVALR
jgi:hypothetical protein